MDEIYTDQFGEPLSEDDIIDGRSNIPEEYFNLPEDEFVEKVDELFDNY